MLSVSEYNRAYAQEYALRWALDRNPLFFDFHGVGGDCTNFCSQCILAGCCVMNYTPTFGWYYISPEERAPAWTGVQYLYNFLVKNTAEGPWAVEVDSDKMEIGDIIQLGNKDGIFYHSLVVTGLANNTYLLSAHSDDRKNRPLNTYKYSQIRYIHIVGARFEISKPDCFDDLINGEKNHSIDI